MTWLHEELAVLYRRGLLADVPACVTDNLNARLELRPYQRQALSQFICHYESGEREYPLQVLFHMATGSGKTLIMAALMLYLYRQGYRNFLFFVNLSNIVDKTRANFLDRSSSKYLFAPELTMDGQRIRIREVRTFSDADPQSINICFTTMQGLHASLHQLREGGMTFDDFGTEPVVLLSDEAHHLKVETRKNARAVEDENARNWELTVRHIVQRQAANVLLEFTATCDLSHMAIRAAYERRIVFSYALFDYYRDRYSKDIITLRSDLTVMDRVLQALVLSQYRMKVFADYHLNIRPLVLFKALTIKDSRSFQQVFHQAVAQLTAADLERVRQTLTRQQVTSLLDIRPLELAFAYFETHGVTLEVLASELRQDFAPEHCLCANDERDVQEQQLSLNTLEAPDSPWRAIFEVRKLDEGWDVLNLFDIVRLYETRQSGGGKISPATLAEAQLIGRGARYCPFVTDEEQPRFQRKYDGDITHELRMCETLVYHCQNDHRYVAELHQALREVGLDLEKTIRRQHRLKASFRREALYREGVIFLNTRERTGRSEVRALPEKVRDREYHYHVRSGMVTADAIMEGSTVRDDLIPQRVRMSIGEIADISYALVHKALLRRPGLRFDRLQQLFPHLRSTREFITSPDYLGAMHVVISGTQDPDMKTLHEAAAVVAEQVEAYIGSIEETWHGTVVFYPHSIRDVFHDKVSSYTVEPHGGGLGISQADPAVAEEWRLDLSNEEWYAYADNYGTSEEKAFVAYFHAHLERLRMIYDHIFLIRNEREFKLYSFRDGQRFEPDFIILLQRRGERVPEQLQVFVEPKGLHLLEQDRWKEEFLLQIEEQAVVSADGRPYRIRGWHFFSTQARRREFEADWQRLLDAENNA